MTLMWALCALSVSCLFASTYAARQPSMMLPDSIDDMSMFEEVPTIAPVIGVLTQPDVIPQSDANISYFAASYAKYAEMGGARVVPVLCDSSKEKLTDLFGKLNGLIVPGMQCETPAFVRDSRPQHYCPCMHTESPHSPSLRE